MACGGFAAALFTACGDDEGTTPPAVTCQPTDPACPATAVQSDCLALVDNRGQDKFAVRLSQLKVNAPAALATDAVANIVSKGVNINLPLCNIPGDGTFNLITEIDLAAGTIRTGGAYPEADPANGYCYVFDPANGVAPVEMQADVVPGQPFETMKVDRVVVPVFQNLEATDVVYLPISKARLVDATLSTDQNCIGSYNLAELSPNLQCLPGEGVEYFVNGGTLDGHITLADADEVEVALLGATLCWLLANNQEMYQDDTTSPKSCARDGMGTILLPGDWCSTTDSAGGCADSFRLEANFAGSAAKLRTDCPEGGSGGGGAAGGMGGAAAGGAGGA